MRVSEMSACIWKSLPDSPILPGYCRNEESAPLRNLIAYLDSVKSRDPAPRSRWEILLYPGVLALGLHRVAHRLFRARLYFLARLITHFSRFLTALDIHPGAQSGRQFFIDHRFTVIGETAQLWDDVTLYHSANLCGTHPATGIADTLPPTI